LFFRQGLFAGQFLRRAAFDHFAVASQLVAQILQCRGEIVLLLAERFQGAAQAFMLLAGCPILMLQAYPIEFEPMDLVA
jgi:hypothetical protein